MENLLGIVKLVDQEFGEIVRNGRFRGKEDVELVYKMMDIVKDAFCIWDYETKLDDGYSEYGNSYARGRNMPRNSMGRFTSRENTYGYNGGNSYRGVNYSRADAKSEFIDQLYALVQNAPDENLRNRAQMMIHEMEQQ